MEYIWIVVAVAIAIGMFKLMQKIGLLSTGQERADTAGANSLPALLKKWSDTKYYYQIPAKAHKSLSHIVTFTKSQLDSLVGSIWDSKGTFSDDEEALYSVFRKLSNQVDVIFLVANFERVHPGRTLIDFIQGYTGDEEQGKIFRIIKGLKPY